MWLKGVVANTDHGIAIFLVCPGCARRCSSRMTVLGLFLLI